MTVTPPLSPWRRTLRTVFQALIGLSVMIPVLVTQTGMKADQWPWLAGVLAVCAVVTRIMAIPQVEAFLQANLSWLAAHNNPAAPRRRRTTQVGQSEVVWLLVVVVVVVLIVVFLVPGAHR